MTYSFCESVHASGRSRWHIRRLTEKGKKLGGGIDTKSLCGVVTVGWDLGVDFENVDTFASRGVVCPACLSEYRCQQS